MLRFTTIALLALALTSVANSQKLVTITPIVSAPDTVVTADSVKLVMTWMARGEKDSVQAPVAMLLPMMNHDRSSWHGLDSMLARQGFRVVSVDMRGQGASTTRAGKSYRWQDFTNADFALMVDDIGAILKHAQGIAQRHVNRTRLDSMLANADFKRVVIVGASIGSSAALLYAADHTEIAGLALLSPGLNYRGLQIEPAMRRYGKRPVYFAAGSRDEASAQAVEKLHAMVKDQPHKTRQKDVTANDAHGTDLFDVEPGVSLEIVIFFTQLLGMPFRQ